MFNYISGYQQSLLEVHRVLLPIIESESQWTFNARLWCVATLAARANRGQIESFVCQNLLKQLELWSELYDDDLLMIDNRTAEETRDKLVERLKRYLDHWIKPRLFHGDSYKMSFYKKFS